MSVAVRPLFEFDNSFVRDLAGLYEPWQAAPVPAPRLLALNVELAVELGVDVEALRSPGGVAVLLGDAAASGASPVAQAYSGHQFGGFSPRLGDGRALLLGEVFDVHGRRRDLHLKGSGRTPFARGGDGKAAVGPMLREYVIGEALHALGIPTTRALAVVATGEQIAREQMLPGAVLVRVAASHLRVGTFQYAAMHDDPTLVKRLADHAIARHYPDAAGEENPYLAFLEGVVETQASLIASWMLVGFIHGVMNTDNMTISGESIDFGPCAFMDAFDPSTVFSSIDDGGRYAYGNQPQIARWNLARLAETLLPLINADTDAAVALATDVLHAFGDRYANCWTAGMRAKLGLGDPDPGDDDLIGDLLALLQADKVDYTSFFRTLSSAVLGDVTPARSRFDDPAAFDAWAVRWEAARSRASRDAPATAGAMNRVNPVYIPRNHKVEEALAAATDGDLGPFQQLIDVLSHPYMRVPSPLDMRVPSPLDMRVPSPLDMRVPSPLDMRVPSPLDERPGLESYAEPAPPSFGRYRTFCGT